MTAYRALVLINGKPRELPDGDTLVGGGSMTAAEILTAVKTVDGSGSGLDADLVRGTTPGATGLSLLALGAIAAGSLFYTSALSTVSALAAGTNGHVLTMVAGAPAWAAPASTVAGSDTQVQFNDGGVLAGDSGLVFNKTTNALTIAGALSAAADTDTTHSIARGKFTGTSDHLRISHFDCDNATDYAVLIGNGYTGFNVKDGSGVVMEFMVDGSPIIQVNSNGSGLRDTELGTEVYISGNNRTAQSWSTVLTADPGVHSNMEAGTELPDIDFQLQRGASHAIEWATGNITTQRAVKITAPTYAFTGASTITNAATVAISGAPAAGTNATITNAYALWVQAGATRLASLILDTALPVGQGGTGATTAGGARTALGLVIGTDVAAQTHATQHQSGGSDSIKLDDLATPDDNTDLDATTGRHGLLPKLGGGSTNFLRADGTWAAPAGGSPGGADTQVQFNDGGAFGGDAGLVFNKTTDALTIGGVISAGADADAVHSIGYGRLGLATSGTATVFYLSQASNFNSTDFGFSQTSAGQTTINSKSGQRIEFSTNGTERGRITATQLLLATAIQIEAQKTTASTSNATGAIITAGGYASSNTTDANSATDGGTFTSAGGGAFAKKLFAGTVWSTSPTTGKMVVGATSSTLGLVLHQSGGNSSSSPFQAHHTSSDGLGFATFHWGSSAAGAVINFTKARGGTVGTWGVVSNNDVVGLLSFQAAGSTSGPTRCAEISVEVDGTPGTNDTPGRIIIKVTPDGSATVAEACRWNNDGTLQFADAKNIKFNATTGTKIGTATTEKIGFWNTTPVVQPAAAAQAALAAYATGAFGLDSNANMQALYDLVMAMRTALVDTGIMKGAA